MDDYQCLALHQRRQDPVALQAFEELLAHLEASPDAIEPSFRRDWIRTILLDLEAHHSGGRTGWSTRTVHRALVTLKHLGRSQRATQDLTSHLPLLIRYANLCPSSDHDLRSSTSLELSIIEEALKILANTLFLHPLSRSSRELSPALGSLARLAAPHRSLGLPSERSAHGHALGFLASRVLFLVTAAPSELVLDLVQGTSLLSGLHDILDSEAAARTRGQNMVSGENLLELLKLIFNAMAHYPRALLAHVGPPTSPGSPCPERGGRPQGQRLSRPSDEGMNLRKGMTDSNTLEETRYQLSHDLCWDSHIPPVIFKVFCYLERITERYDDPDDAAVADRCAKEGVVLDADLTQIVLLLANLIFPNRPSPDPSSIQSCRDRLRQRIVPVDCDRSRALQKQSTFVGRILRLVNCVGCDSLSFAAGSLLFALYNQDVDFLISQIGYGPMAGYLMRIGASGLNPDSHHEPPPDVNPITGMWWPSGDPAENQPPSMTPEEKEREAERLCDLFDRMNRNGVIKVQDPRRAAVDSGGFEEIKKTVEQEQEVLDNEEEEQVVMELKRYRERRKPTS